MSSTTRPTAPLFMANTVNPKRLYEIIRGVSLRTKDLGHISITNDGISVKAGAIGQFQAVSFIPREFFYSYIFNGTEPLEVVIALKDLYGILGITQDAKDQYVEELLEDPFNEFDRYIITGENEDDESDQTFEASFKYEKVGAAFKVELFDDTSSSIVEIIPLLQDPLYDIPEPPDRVIFFKILCYDLRMILKDCFRTGSKFQLNGYQHEITVLRFSSRNEYRFVEHNIRREAFHQCRIVDDFQFTYPKICVQPLLSFPVSRGGNVEVAIYTNGLMKMTICPDDVQNSYINYIAMTMVEGE